MFKYAVLQGFLTFESEDAFLKSDHSNESYSGQYFTVVLVTSMCILYKEMLTFRVCW